MLEITAFAYSAKHRSAWPQYRSRDNNRYAAGKRVHLFQKNSRTPSKNDTATMMGSAHIFLRRLFFPADKPHTTENMGLTAKNSKRKTLAPAPTVNALPIADGQSFKTGQIPSMQCGFWNDYSLLNHFDLHFHSMKAAAKINPTNFFMGERYRSRRPI